MNRVLEKPGQRDETTKRQEELTEYVKLTMIRHAVDDWEDIKEVPAKSITAALIKVGACGAGSR